MKLTRSILWMSLSATGLLIVLSIVGAFYGAQKAKIIFNSIPLAFYWYGLAVLLLAGLVEFPRLLRKPGLFMIHTGCLAVLVGSMWGSEAGHRLSNRFLGTQKIPNGYMRIYKGQSENKIVKEDLEQLGQLPFNIKLNDFHLEYYDSEKEPMPQLNIETDDGQQFQLTAKSGEEISLGPDKGRLKVVRTFKNFKIKIEDGKKTAVDEEGGENPAVEVEIEKPDGTSYTRYVFERFEGHSQAEDGIELSYASEGQRMIRDYYSDVTVIENGKEALSKTIEVNHPLHYSGYHFYQHSYDTEEGQYTILSVTSDSGLYVVYGGYWMLCIGVMWQFWFGAIIRHIKGEKTNKA